MIVGHANVHVFLSHYNDYLEVLMKMLKDGQSRVCIRHEGGHNTGILLHLLQQPEYLLPLSLHSLIQVFNCHSSFFIWCICNSFVEVILEVCTYDSNNALVVEPIYL